MKRSTFLRVLLGGVGSFKIAENSARAQTPKATVPVNPPPPAKDRSLQLEIEHAIDRGLHSLQDKQNSAGYWSVPEMPGITALVLTAFVKEPSGIVKAEPPDFVKKGYDYLLQAQQADGGIYLKGLANYTTAVCMQALQAADPVAYASQLRRARQFLVGLQGNYPPESGDAVYNGGIGYDPQDALAPKILAPGEKAPAPAVAAGAASSSPASHLHYDLSNTAFALEALKETQHLADSTNSEARDLNWAAAIGFIERCQNLPASNHQSWVKSDPKNLGGFVYEPLNKKGLLSYGSMSYAGLLSYIHADLKKDDPRVLAVFDWLSHNYTLEENPGMGADGVYYYYQMMSKALSAHGTDKLTLADGKQVAWSSDLALKLINLQETDGTWVNSSGRWWEKDPTLVTSYAVLTLETLHSQV